MFVGAFRVVGVLDDRKENAVILYQVEDVLPF